MSEQSSSQSQTSPALDAEQVSDYLRRHPDFFQHQGELLTELHVPHQQNGAISLVERQTSLLREQNRKLKGQLDELIDTARQNDLQFEKVRRLIVNLLEAHTLDEALVAVEEGLCQEFNADTVRLLTLSGRLQTPAHNIKSVPESEAAAVIGNFLNSDWAICGSLAESENRYLFDSQADKVLSAAVIPLSKGHTLGVLAIGSYQAHYFHSSMGTLFLNYIGEVLSRVLYSLDQQQSDS